MAGRWDSVWEKVLSGLLTANIAVMGWLWTNIARLADRLDKHIEDRAIHETVDRAEFVGRREFEVWRESDAASRKATGEAMARLQDRVERASDARKRAGD